MDKPSKQNRITYYFDNKYIFKECLIRSMFFTIIIVFIIVLTLSYNISFPMDKAAIISDNKTNITNKNLINTEAELSPLGEETEPFENLTEQEVFDSINIISAKDMHIPDGVDNITGWPHNIVPNIVHYILFENHRISYVHMLSFFSVLKMHKPDKIIIHCDCDRLDDNNPNWERILREINATNEVTVLINRIEKPTQIYGRQLHGGNYHASDVTRYRIMNEYGGIYLDNDVFVCQSLNTFLKYEFTLNWDEGQFMASQILIGARKSRVSRLIMETYKAYNPKLWYFNAGEFPTDAILNRYPHLVHRVKVKFGVDAPAACQYFYKEYNAHWSNEYYSFHMLIRGDQLGARSKAWCLQDGTHFMWDAVINDDFLKSLNTTFGEMGRYILFGNKKIR